MKAPGLLASGVGGGCDSSTWGVQLSTLHVRAEKRLGEGSRGELGHEGPDVLFLPSHHHQESTDKQGDTHLIVCGLRCAGVDHLVWLNNLAKYMCIRCANLT